MIQSLFKRSYTLPAIAGLLFLTCGMLQSSYTPTAIKEGYVAGGDSQTSSALALAHAAGEFRIVAANMLWMNVVDHYHHQYMAQGHSWTTDVELLPMMNLITNLDPHFTQAYYVSAQILMHVNRFSEASQILIRGEHNNPTDWNMPYNLAMMYGWFLKNPNLALPYAQKAKALTTDPFYTKMVGRLVHTLQGDIADNAKIKLHASRSLSKSARARKTGQTIS